MGDISVSTAALERGLTGAFQKTFKATAPHPLAALASFSNSANLSERYVGFGEVAEMVEFVDEKIEKGLVERALTVLNKRYEATHKIHKDAIRLDNTGSALQKMQSITLRGKVFPGKLISELIVAGTGTTISACYDGGAFFSATHPALGNSGAQSNLLSGGGVTSAQMKVDFNAAIAAFRGMKDTQGAPINDGLDLDLVAVVPPALESAAREFLGADILSNTTNVDKSRAKYIVDARLTDLTDWYLFNLADPGTMPFGLQENDPLKPTFLGDGSDTFFRTGFMLYGAEWMGRAYYGWFQNAIKINNS